MASECVMDRSSHRPIPALGREREMVCEDGQGGGLAAAVMTFHQPKKKKVTFE